MNGGRPIHQVGNDAEVLGMPSRRPETRSAFRMLCRHNRWVQEFGKVRDPDEISRREKSLAGAGRGHRRGERSAGGGDSGGRVSASARRAPGRNDLYQEIDATSGADTVSLSLGALARASTQFVWKSSDQGDSLLAIGGRVDGNCPDQHVVGAREMWSTALMYSFAQRADTRVVDEPLYGYYLQASGARHPGRDEVLAAMDTDGERVVREVILGPSDRPVLFLKQMAHHLPGLDPSFLRQTRNVLLIREPEEMLLSLRRQIPEPVLRDTGLGVQRELIRTLRSLGQDPPVLESRQLLLDPPGVLAQLCDYLEIPFDEAMLSWPAGPRPEDGVWAPHWYDSVHRSTGFQPWKAKDEPLPLELEGPVGGMSRLLRGTGEQRAAGRNRLTLGLIPGVGPRNKRRPIGKAMLREYEPHELPDPRNASILVHVGGALVPRKDAKVFGLRQLGAGWRCGLGRPADLLGQGLPAGRPSRPPVRVSACPRLSRGAHPRRGERGHPCKRCGRTICATRPISA